MTRVKLCLALSGGVSLGSYIGGALFELLYALANNKNREADIRFAVLTGASAGSMTAALTARALLYERVPPDDLREAWVRRIGARQLLQRERAMPGRPRLGLLAESHLRRLAHELLPRPAAPPAAPSFVDRHLLMGFTLANVDGIPYAINFANRSREEASFSSTLYADRIVFGLPANEPPAGGLRVWDDIRQAALASGAFPLAFEPKLVRRALSDFRESLLTRLGDVPESTLMLYSDGGVFDNEPIGFARDLAEIHEELTGDGRPAEYRYIFVDPNRTPEQAFPFRETEDEYHNTFFGFVGDYAGMIFGQSRFQDWVRTRKVNQRLDWLAETIELFAAAPEAFTARRAEITRQAERMAAFKVERMNATRRRHYHDSAAAYLEANRARIAVDARYAPVQRLNEPARDVLIDLIFVLENVAALRNKVELRPYLVTPEPGALAGDFIRSFGGLLDARLREHDWRIGRRTMRTFLTEQASWRDLIEYDPATPISGSDALDAGDPYRWHEDYRDVGLSDLDEARTLLEHFVGETVDDLMREAGIGWIFRKLLRRRLTRDVLRRLE